MIGLIGKKKGMSSVFDEKGRHIAVTIVEAGPCPITQVKTNETDGYESLQIGFDPKPENRVNQPMAGHFKSKNVKPHAILREFRDFQGEYKVGDTLTVDLFQPGDKINIVGISKGRGFTGVIKRHNFRIPNRTHGTHEAFRHGGSIGQGSYPARVWPGLKMAGRMGGSRVTVKNLRVVKIDKEKSLLMIKGAIPGANNGYVLIKKNW